MNKILLAGMTLDQLGHQCQDRIARGHRAIVVEMVAAARSRIEKGEPYPGGFDMWWDMYGPASPWPVSELLPG
jgi:hypothetical protein